MARTVEINGTTYTVPELDFNAVAELSENGVDIFSRKNGKKNALQLIRGIAAWIMGTDVDEAGTEIGEHIIANGELPPLMDILREEIETSNFLNALRGKSEKEGTLSKIPQDHKRKATKTGD